MPKTEEIIAASLGGLLKGLEKGIVARQEREDKINELALKQRQLEIDEGFKRDKTALLEETLEARKTKDEAELKLKELEQSRKGEETRLKSIDVGSKASKRKENENLESAKLFKGLTDSLTALSKLENQAQEDISDLEADLDFARKPEEQSLIQAKIEEKKSALEELKTRKLQLNAQFEAAQGVTRPKDIKVMGEEAKPQVSISDQILAAPDKDSAAAMTRAALNKYKNDPEMVKKISDAYKRKYQSLR